VDIPPPLATGGRNGDLHRALLDVWPSPGELDIILEVPASTSVLFHGVICMPYSSVLSKDKAAQSWQDILRLPPPDSHPVMIARKLLLLGTFLQGIPSNPVKGSGTMSRLLVETASKLVTNNDDLVNSLEGIECLMIEGMFHNNTGNLRRAWITHRKAMSIAQMMGLHRAPSPTAKVVDAETQARIDPEYMWYRLVITDRYLSLMLGLPQASLESPFGSPEALASCTPMERMERMQSIAGGRILQRINVHDLAETHEADKLLREAASLMPPQWWLAPSISDTNGDGNNALTETLRLMNQFTHYHLLAQLHLPYLLHPSDDRRYDYSKITTVTASREILLLFVPFRSSGAAVTAYCRGVDFLAFIASTVLTLAHIDTRRRRAPYVLGFLAHQRQSDRGLLERTLECMENMAQGNSDAMARRISDVLRRLLSVEANAANGLSYCSTVASNESGAELEASGMCLDDTLQINIPYFGTVKIEETKPLPLVRRVSPAPGPVGYQIGELSANADWQNVPSHLDSLTEAGDGRLTPDRSLLVPGLAADVDDWALQGVDMALFGNLIWGATELDELASQGLAGP